MKCEWFGDGCTAEATHATGDVYIDGKGEECDFDPPQVLCGRHARAYDRMHRGLLNIGKCERLSREVAA